MATESPQGQDCSEALNPTDLYELVEPMTAPGVDGAHVVADRRTHC